MPSTMSFSCNLKLLYAIKRNGNVAQTFFPFLFHGSVVPVVPSTRVFRVEGINCIISFLFFIYVFVYQSSNLSLRPKAASQPICFST